MHSWRSYCLNETFYNYGIAERFIPGSCAGADKSCIFYKVYITIIIVIIIILIIVKGTLTDI